MRPVFALIQVQRITKIVFYTFFRWQNLGFAFFSFEWLFIFNREFTLWYCSFDWNLSVMQPPPSSGTVQISAVELFMKVRVSAKFLVALVRSQAQTLLNGTTFYTQIQSNPPNRVSTSIFLSITCLKELANVHTGVRSRSQTRAAGLVWTCTKGSLDVNTSVNWSVWWLFLTVWRDHVVKKKKIFRKQSIFPS